MNILGIVAEFNPFHNGHRYLIEKAKKEARASFCIIVMSGNFVQRGEPALMDKYARTEIALKNGADLVIELPVAAATASAEGFAYGAVSLLNSLGIVSHIAFGSENTDLSLLDRIADILIDEPVDFKNELRKLCSDGVSYPAARTLALKKSMPDTDIESILNAPNCILSIEYLKALKRVKSRMTPIAIKRLGANYNDSMLHTDFSSASALRNAIKINTDYKSSVPENEIAIIENYRNTRDFIFEEDIFPILLSKLLTKSAEELSQYADCNISLANKVKNNCFDFTDYPSILDCLSSKDYTLSRIKRVLTHILLDIDQTYIPSGAFSDHTARYARVLGCGNKELLSEIAKKSDIPVITRLSRQLDTLDGNLQKFLMLDINAAHLYEAVTTIKTNSRPLNEFCRKLISI